jgi:hypothetical protein
MKIERTSGWHRPMHADKYELSSIKFFNPKTGIVEFVNNSGWLEQNSNDIVRLHLPGCKRKIKLNLSVKHPYILKEIQQYAFDNGKYTLYIPTTMVSFKSLGVEMRNESDTSKQFYDTFEIKIEGSTDFDVSDSTLTINLSSYIRTEKKELGLEIEKMEELLNKKGIKMSRYEVKKLLASFIVIDKDDISAIRKEKLKSLNG